MKPGLYLDCLEYVAERDGLEPSNLHPVLASDILAVERELGAQLPEQYEDFLMTVGAGSEHGGLANWLHLDITRRGNLLEFNQCFAKEQIQNMRSKRVPTTRFPRNFLAVFDPCDGELFGFLQSSAPRYLPQVFGWDTESFEIRAVADEFEGFLDYIADCDPAVIEQAREARRLVGQDDFSVADLDPATLFD